MTDTTAPRTAPLDGSVMFYRKPEPLSVEAHGKLGVSQVDRPYAFVGQANFVPLTVTEFSPAALSYPVVFVGDARQPVAVMGVNENVNLFVDESGAFRGDAYIPGFVRRYPFVFANDPANERMILCIDRDADFVKEGGESPLFVDGQPSDYTKQAMEFCNSFEQERIRTESFVKLLTDLDLLEVRESHYTPRNEKGEAQPQQKLAEYYAVSEDKLRALPADKLAELRDNGALGQIYAHLVSLLGWDRLVGLAMLRASGGAPVANGAFY